MDNKEEMPLRCTIDWAFYAVIEPRRKAMSIDSQELRKILGFNHHKLKDYTVETTEKDVLEVLKLLHITPGMMVIMANHERNKYLRKPYRNENINP